MADNSSIAVTVKLFAIYQEAFGKPELNLNFSQPITVGSVLETLIEQKPELAQWRDVTRFGVNLKFVESDTLLEDRDEVVLIPPVSGG
ncbi:MoaD/ThiS family protein [Myxosarcina sp. GI1(2024)]